MCATASSLPKMVRKHQAPSTPAIDHGADRIARLQVSACSNVNGLVRRSYLRIWKARIVPMPMISTANGHSSTLPVLSAVKTAATAVQIEPANIGQKFWHMESTSAA